MDVPERYKVGCTKPQPALVRIILCGVACFLASLIFYGIASSTAPKLQAIFFLMACGVFYFIWTKLWPMLRDKWRNCRKYKQYEDIYEGELEAYEDAAKANKYAEREMSFREREEALAHRERHADHGRHRDPYSFTFSRR